jgi:transposase
VLSVITATGKRRYSVTDHAMDGERYVAFLQQVLRGRTRPLVLIADRVSFHRSAVVRQFVRAHRRQLRLFFFPTHSPELNPGEQVWNEVKHRKIGKQPIKNKRDLKKRLYFELKSLQQKAEKIRSFFKLPDTEYAAIPDSA